MNFYQRLLTSKTKQEFIEVVSSHDWYYAYSDDSGVYNEGRREFFAIQEACKRIPLLLKVWQAYSGYHWKINNGINYDVAKEELENDLNKIEE